VRQSFVCELRGVGLLSERIGDRVYEAYLGAMGEPLAITTRARIHWISERVVGNSVLDIGCSQGILPIILAREGKKVDGVDIDEEAISYANDKLAQEEGLVRDRVRFTVADFFELEVERRYDTVVLSELIEHLVFPQRALDKAIGLLNPGGRLLISVPFGINDAADHKRTYYGTKLLLYLSQRMVLSDRYLIKGGKGYWLCLSWDLPSSTRRIDDPGLMEKLDWIEQSMLERERDLSEKLAEASAKMRAAVADHQALSKKSIVDAVDIGALQERLARSQADLADEVNAGKSLKNELEGKLRSAEEVLSKTLKDLENANLELTRMGDALHMCENELKLLQSLRSEISRLTEETGRLNGMVERISFENSKLSMKVEELNGQYRSSSSAEVLLRGKMSNLEEKLASAHGDLSRSHQLIDRQRAELDEQLSIINKISEHAANELKEEKRILKEYAKLDQERRKLLTKISMYERSKSGILLMKMWKLINKIRHP